MPRVVSTKRRSIWLGFEPTIVKKGASSRWRLLRPCRETGSPKHAQLASQAVERGSQDPLHYIWLADLAYSSGDHEGAQQNYRAALQKFPKDVRVWNAVFSHFVQTDQPQRAQQTLQRWTEQVPMSEVQKLLVLGQGNEALGDHRAAEDFYRQATAKDPQDVASRYLLAKSLASSDVAAARRAASRARDRPNANRSAAIDGRAAHSFRRRGRFCQGG